MKTAGKEFEQTRKSLVNRLKNWDDDESWQQFFNTYWRLIYSVAIQAGLREPEAEDAVQETIITVAKTMPSFQYDRSTCTFKSWLRHLAQKRIIDQFRKRPPAGPPVVDWTQTASRTDSISRLPDPKSLELDSVWDAEWEKRMFHTALSTVRTQAKTKQFQIFDFYVLRAWPVKKVADTLNVSATQVYIARHRITRLIKKEIQRLEQHGI